MKPGRDAAAWILARFEFLALGSPVLVLVCLLFLLPLCNVLLLSVTEPSPGLGNYALLFTSQARGTNPTCASVAWATLRSCPTTLGTGV